ncbi:hypothetical protein O181_108650 [Austropuccinia psidii MF-1]|uniref:Uncharacterized protein n=1 Tax=Austropuccinia psidii MF-1 TaxID=1389203 RepID=A0A9Q3JST0_9BASI|nr:hypothetical protein [Austropuccinia psidii MF-1]
MPISMIKCPTHSPITAYKTSNCAIIMLEGDLALTNPPLHGHMHMLTHPPLCMHMLMHPPPRMHTPMQPHHTCGIVRWALPVSSTK